ncbi:MAG: hypothetical protein IKW83_08845 [Muribaculaceae bacterium]|nr:hypothetical protein [Muribaculaceae bacterium]
MPRSIGRAVSPRLLQWLESLTGYKIEVIQSPEERGTTLMARRINVGNAGKDAVVEMPLRFKSMRDIKRFAESVTDVLSTDQGDKMLEPEDARRNMCCLPDYDDYGDDDYCDMLEVARSSRSVEHEHHAERKKSWLKLIKYKKKESKNVDENVDDIVYDDNLENDSCEYFPAPEIAIEEDEIINIEQEREMALKAIQAQILDYVTKFHADPSQLINTLLEGKIVIGQKDQLSPLVVNNDLKIVLPNFNEVEVKMPAMCRAIYILFLKHTEGIALRDIGDYRAELEDIYSIVMPGRSEEKAKEAIDNLLDPMSNTLNEYISKIKRCFKSCIIDDELASNYIITGKRNEPYRIALDSSLISLPRAVKG